VQLAHNAQILSIDGSSLAGEVKWHTKTGLRKQIFRTMLGGLIRLSLALRNQEVLLDLFRM
jgi:hypothetical protein